MHPVNASTPPSIAQLTAALIHILLNARIPAPHHDEWTPITFLSKKIVETWGWKPSLKPPPADIVKELRASHPDVHVRLALNEGYEVSLSQIPQSDQDERSMFIENIPASARSIDGLLTLLDLLAPSSYTHLLAINTSIFGAPDGLPQGRRGIKSIEEVVLLFDEPKWAQQVLSRLPWQGRATGQDVGPGTRSCSMKYLLLLKDQYLVYQSQALSLTTTSASASRTKPHTPAPPRPSQPAPRPPPAAFPRGCLLLARNIPLGANKTLIKTLVNSSLGSRGEVDYVDWSKGRDYAYIRVPQASHSAYLAEHPTATGEQGDKDIVYTMIGGKQEESYWMALPDKIRLQAIEKQ